MNIIEFKNKTFTEIIKRYLKSLGKKVTIGISSMNRITLIVEPNLTKAEKQKLLTLLNNHKITFSDLYHITSFTEVD